MEDFQKKFVLALLAYGAQRALTPQILCELSGINYKSLTQKTNVSLQPEHINSLWENASLLSNDPLFGLHFGESMQLAALGVVGQIVQTSNNVGEALTNACALTHLITDMFQMRIDHGRSRFTVHITAHGAKARTYPFTYRHMADYLMVFTVHELNGLLLEKILPVSARFPYPITAREEYERIFQCTITAKTTALSLEFDNKHLSHPVLSANYALQNHLLQKMNVLLRNNCEAGTLQTRIYNYLLTNTYLHALSLKAVAANFNLSPRSLQRKLKEEGVTYFQIIEDVRKTLALNYLNGATYSIKDISHILGYNEQSAFLRAFKRWTLKTPLEYQKERTLSRA